MSKLFGLVLVGFGVFACYHYWPKETTKVGHKIADTSVSAVKAGYETAKR
jgi:hypothetical protein